MKGKKGTTGPEDMLDFMVGMAFIIIIFLVCVALISFKDSAKNKYVGISLGSIDSTYELTTLLRMPIGDATFADFAARKYYGENVDAELTAAVESFFKGSVATCAEVIIYNDNVVYNYDAQEIFTGKYSQVEYTFCGNVFDSFAQSEIPTAGGKVLTVELRQWYTW